MPQRGRPPKFNAEHRATFSAIVEVNRISTLKEIREQLEPRTGVRAHSQTLLVALREAKVGAGALGRRLGREQRR